MQISTQKNLVTLTPDTPQERAMLQAVWRLLIDCNGDARKLTPIGALDQARAQPSAQFVIEGAGADQLPEIPTVVVDIDCKVYCDTCNRIQDLTAGQIIPPCCGKLMAFMD